jgi:DNA polymerase III epsilon subunit-like protein
MNWKHLPIVAFDTETTGLQPFTGDKVIEFAAVIFQLDDEGSIASTEEHSFLMNPGIPIPRKVTEITGITDSDVHGKPSFSHYAQEIFDLLSGAITIAHNFPFDRSFLEQSFLRVGSHWPSPVAEIDTFDLSIKLFSDAKAHKLIDVCNRLDVVLSGAHRATNDAAACGRCFIEMIRRHKPPDDLQALLNWAGAIGGPPENGPFASNEVGKVLFTEGVHKGKPIIEQPVHLAWMLQARTQGEKGWRFRYSESVRKWIARWLKARTSGRARQHIKSFKLDDWVLDSCNAVDKQKHGLLQ